MSEKSDGSGFKSPADQNLYDRFIDLTVDVTNLRDDHRLTEAERAAVDVAKGAIDQAAQRIMRRLYQRPREIATANEVPS